MKKIYTLICFGVFLNISLFAQHKDSYNIIERLFWDDKMLNIMLDTRTDFRINYSENDIQNISFQGQTFKIWIVGEIIPGIRYRVRHRLNRGQDSFLREGYSGATDHAWLAFDIGKSWTITAGKQSVQLGTFEFDYNPADVYLSSMVNNDFDGYKTGVNVGYHFLNQTLNLQIVNSDAPQFAHSSYANKAMAFNLLWEGNLFNDILKTRWGYGAFQHTKTKFYNWITLGTQLNIMKFTLELDYFTGNRNMNYGDIVHIDDLGTRYVMDQSASVNLVYNFGKIKPAIKGVWNNRKDVDFDENAYESSGIQALVEYYPFTNNYIKDLRFHIMYSYSNTNFKSRYNNLPSEDMHTALVGVRWLFKAK